MTTTVDFGLKLQAVADAIATAIGAITGLTVFAYDPLGEWVVQGATATVGDMVAERVDLEEPEAQQGSVVWYQNWTVRLYIPLDDADTAYTSARSFMGLIVASIDANRQLGGEARDCKVVSFAVNPNTTDETRRALVGEATVRALMLMPDVWI